MQGLQVLYGKKEKKRMPESEVEGDAENNADQRDVEMRWEMIAGWKDRCIQQGAKAVQTEWEAVGEKKDV